MPAYRFSWDAFEDGTVRALARAAGFQGPVGDAREWLGKAVKRPTPEFTGAMKDALTDHWIPTYAGASEIVDRLIDAGVGPMGNPRSARGFAQYIRDCRNSKSVRQFLCDALLRYGDVDRDEDAGSGFIRRFAVIQTKQQRPDGRQPHPYQVEVWQQLNKHLGEARSTGKFQGLVVMPTGSGKTYTAVRWVYENVVASGKRVLWLAHRRELLTQAAAEFHALSSFVRSKEKLRVRVVSSEHCTTTQIDPADDVVVASIHSLARRRDIASQLLDDPRLFVVIDEAHHAPAKSYRDLIIELQESRTWSVLGLTATPTRTAQHERPELNRLFGGRIIAQVEMARLIEQKILARPIPIVVRTHADVERGMTDDDRQHYDKFNEISEEWLDRIAHITDRNALIVEHYLGNRTKYGPTLIFAINVAHAVLLADHLKSKGVRAEYVASYRPDGSQGDPAAVIQQFREGKTDVLVNVQMVTEGVDLPRVDTVFLTRPTTSEVLMRQMVGRALRGPAAGGSDKAYLVSFEDHWEQFRDWDSPFDLVVDITEAGGTDTREPTEPKPGTGVVDELPWDVVRDVAARLRTLGPGHEADAFEAVPDGWLVLERVEEDHAIRQPIAIYQHQRPCWDALLGHLQRLGPASLAAASTDALYQDYFADCDPPAPSLHHVGLVVEHLKAGGPRPQAHPLQGRDECDPYLVGKAIFDRDLGPRAAGELVDRAYTALAKAIYPNRRDYQQAIDDAVYELRNPKDSTRRAKGIPIFDPRPEDQLRPGPTHDLPRLMTEVLEQGKALLGLEVLTFDGTLEWSSRLIKGWYGMAYPTEVPTRIRINRLLDSPDFDAEHLRFLLWHEFLHVHLRQGHTPTFRELERKWPTHVAADRALDTLNERFGIQYW